MTLRIWISILCLNLLGTGWAGELTLGSLFQDHMVLQRDMPVPVWGTAEVGQPVTVKFAGQSQSTTVGEDGKWRVDLDPMPASFQPRTLTVSTDPQTADGDRQCADVLVGEVWICSGQSNMQMGIAGVKELQELVPMAKNIRSFRVENTVSFEESDTCGGTWEVEVPNSAVAFGFAYFLEAAVDAPVGVILSCWGSSSIEAWMPRDLTEHVPQFKTVMDEFDGHTEFHQQIRKALNGPKPWSRAEDILMRRQPNIVYNAMMKPLAPYACRGLAWYQGERNARAVTGMPDEPWYYRNICMREYGKALQCWVGRYRELWQKEDLHFLVVMLPGYAKGLEKQAENPNAPSWAWMRESQLQSLELPGCSVATTIDLGHLTNIHPKDKLPIGQRLALLAQRDTLGMNVVAEGPVMQRIENLEDRIVVHYENAAGLTTSDGTLPKAFWIADDSRKWVQAKSEIIGETVVLSSSKLSSSKLKRPLHVRYAFAAKPEVNLVNKAGLPARPFRSDSFLP